MACVYKIDQCHCQLPTHTLLFIESSKKVSLGPTWFPASLPPTPLHYLLFTRRYRVLQSAGCRTCMGPSQLLLQSMPLYRPPPLYIVYSSSSQDSGVRCFYHCYTVFTSSRGIRYHNAAGKPTNDRAYCYIRGSTSHIIHDSLAQTYTMGVARPPSTFITKAPPHSLQLTEALRTSWQPGLPEWCPKQTSLYASLLLLLTLAHAVHLFEQYPNSRLQSHPDCPCFDSVIRI